jgi:hypothetical protein
MSTQPRLHPTRRTVLRTVAWTAPAVSIAVAAPAFAMSLIELKGVVTSTGIRKYSDKSVKHVEWKLDFTNTGNADLVNPSFDFSFADNSGSSATSFTISSPTGSWSITSQAGLIATYDGTIAVGGKVSITVDFVGANNASGTVGVAVYSGPTLVATGSANF